MDTYVFSIPLFQADLISEAKESEILNEMRFLADSSDTYINADALFRNGDILHIGCAVDGEDFYAAHAIACEEVARALAAVEGRDERGRDGEERDKFREWSHLRQERWILAQKYFDIDRGREPRDFRKMF